MKTKDLRQQSPSEWSNKLAVLRKELYDLKAKASTGKLDKPTQMRGVRRDIARVLTLQQEGKK